MSSLSSIAYLVTPKRAARKTKQLSFLLNAKDALINGAESGYINNKLVFFGNGSMFEEDYTGD